MEQRFRKPRVFLSHSKKDADFIERLADDLRNSQIDPWLDTAEIRHGKSWQDSIFEYGLTTCDAILVYFTQFSIQSPVVKKEIDAGLLQKLDDNNIAFLPYVEDPKIRELLRLDIQALQTPEWNESNYYSLLPRVVAEIWRSFLERTVASATKDERLRRTELELEISRNQNTNFFTAAENGEFEFIWNSFDKTIPLVISQRTIEKTDGSNIVNSYPVDLYLSTLVACLVEYGQQSLDWNHVNFRVEKEAAKFLGILPQFEDDKELYLVTLEGLPNLTKELLMYGLLEDYPYTTSGYGGQVLLTHENLYSKKYFRFRFWLAHNGKLPNALGFKSVSDS